MDVNVKGRSLPSGGRRGDGAGGPRLDRQRVVGLRSPLAVQEPVRVPSCAASLRQARSRTRSRSRPMLNLTRSSRTYWASSGVRVNTLTLAVSGTSRSRRSWTRRALRSPMGRCSTRARRSAVVLPRLRRVVVRHRLERRRRRRLVGLVALPTSRTSSTPYGAGARRDWIDKLRPRTRRSSAASRGRGPRTSTTRSALRVGAAGWPSARQSPRRRRPSVALLLRERRDRLPRS